MNRSTINSPDYRVPIADFSQIVRVPPGGTTLYVSGLTARGEAGTVVGEGDPARQMEQIFENLRTVLAAADATPDDVVSIRTYVRDIGCWNAIEPVWRRQWTSPWPASTLVEVSALFDPRQLIELEATAVVHR